MEITNLEIGVATLTRNQIFHHVYQTASFIKHQHLQGFKFNLNHTDEIRVTLRIQLIPKVFVHIGYSIYKNIC